MLVNNGDAVRTGNCLLLWDGITRPNQKDDGSTEWSVKVAIPENSPEYQELVGLATKALQESELKGQLGSGSWPFLAPDLEKFGERINGHICFNAKTRLKQPEIFNLQGRPLNAMEFGSQLYAGCVVQVLVNAYYFNNKSFGKKGISIGLSGVMIVDHTTPAFAIAGGMSPEEIAAAFGGATPGMGGIAQPGAPVVQPGAPAGGIVAPPVPAPVVPNPAILTPEQRLTAKATGAGYTYAALVGAGWTDAQLVAEGYLNP